jgi:hypothetical protein
MGVHVSILRVSIADMIALNVRAKGRGNRELPAALYQLLPEKAMALMATIPCGTFAVSIPGSISSGCGCPILKTVPPAIDGFVAMYSRKPNGRYEAVAVLYQGKSCLFAEFIPFARRWVEEHVGMLKAIPGRYCYFAPAREEWGVILRDGGYIAWDVSGMPSELTADLRTRRYDRDSSGILARIPVFAGEKWLREGVLPVFARAEVMIDSNSNHESDWISFEEYRTTREDQARLPDSIAPAFHEWLRRLTEESGFKRWIFRSGMLFGDCMEWWGDGSRRRTEHEGLDFAIGVLPGGGIRDIPEGVPVRSPADGEVVAVLDDFIGKTVAVRHPAISRPDGCTFHTLLSHIKPLVKRRDSMVEGQIVGTVGKSTNASAPVHLHLTGAWIPKTLVADEIRMDHIHTAFAPVALVGFNDWLRGNPLCSLDLPKCEQDG